jgi:hypothetical protein
MIFAADPRLAKLTARDLSRKGNHHDAADTNLR